MSHRGTVSGQCRTEGGDTELTVFSPVWGFWDCPITLGTRSFGTRDSESNDETGQQDETALAAEAGD
jgi:hypothetical protein